MPYFNCDPCKKSFPLYPSLVFHYQTSVHKGKDHHPARENCLTDAVPEGYTLVLPKSKAPSAPQIQSQTGQQEPDAPAVDPHPAPSEEIATATRAAVAEKTGPYKSAPQPSVILRDILDKFPGLSPDVVAEVMSWAELSGTLHPYEVGHLLNQMAGVPKGAASIIPQKYQMALQKAAAEGSAEVQMTMNNWQMGMPVRSNSPGPFPGMGGMPGSAVVPVNYPQSAAFGPGQFGMTPWPNFGGYQGYPQNWAANPGPQALQPAGTPAVVDDPRIDQLTTLVTGLSSKLDALEEKKKEDAINARLDKLEELILTVASAGPKVPEGPSPLDGTLSDIKGQIDSLKADLASERSAKLEEKLEKLEASLAATKDDRINALETQLAEVSKKAERPPVVGRTEMDVVGDIATKGLDTVKSLGEDIRTAVMAPHTRQVFSPGRIPPQERVAAGEKITRVVEKEATLVEKEDALLASKKVE